MGNLCAGAALRLLRARSTNARESLANSGQIRCVILPRTPAAFWSGCGILTHFRSAITRINNIATH